MKQKIYNSADYPDAAPVQKDLLFVASNWTSSSFDLWEEESSLHFYTLMVQRKALIMGSSFAKDMGDSETASTLSAAAEDLTETLSDFWSGARNIILYAYGPVLLGKSSYKDISVILAVLHGYNGDEVYSYTNDQVLATAYAIAVSFLPIYGVAKTTSSADGQVLGIPVGYVHEYQ